MSSPTLGQEQLNGQKVEEMGGLFVSSRPSALALCRSPLSLINSPFLKLFALGYKCPWLALNVLVGQAEKIHFTWSKASC